MSKLKVISNMIPSTSNRLSTFFEVVSNPLHGTKVPDGRYLIRGDTKNHSKSYYVLGDIWYLSSEDTEADNCKAIINASVFKLFPNLSEKEWAFMNKIPRKRLNKYWKIAIAGYNFHMRCKERKRSMRMKLIKIKKNAKN